MSLIYIFSIVPLNTIDTDVLSINSLAYNMVVSMLKMLNMNCSGTSFFLELKLLMWEALHLKLCLCHIIGLWTIQSLNDYYMPALCSTWSILFNSCFLGSYNLVGERRSMHKKDYFVKLFNLTAYTFCAYIQTAKNC